jgi:hypothetical protein
MRTLLLFFLLLTSGIISCDSPYSEKTKQPFLNTEQQSKLTPSNACYKLSVNGDFNGDNVSDTLYESLINSVTKECLFGYFNGHIEYDEQVDSLIKLYPYCYLFSNSSKIDTLIVSNHKQQFGLSRLKNEGDLDDNGTDELSYIINYADWSNVNTFHLVTYSNGNWTKMISFSIRDWQIEKLKKEGFIKKITSNRILVKTFDDEANEIDSILYLNK